ncbi:hypothetical protein D3C83_206720 [compost metagenome]
MSNNGALVPPVSVRASSYSSGFTNPSLACPRDRANVVCNANAPAVNGVAADVPPMNVHWPS